MALLPNTCKNPVKDQIGSAERHSQPVLEDRQPGSKNGKGLAMLGQIVMKKVRFQAHGPKKGRV